MMVRKRMYDLSQGVHEIQPPASHMSFVVSCLFTITHLSMHLPLQQSPMKAYNQMRCSLAVAFVSQNLLESFLCNRIHGLNSKFYKNSELLFVLSILKVNAVADFCYDSLLCLESRINSAELPGSSVEILTEQATMNQVQFFLMFASA